MEELTSFTVNVENLMCVTHAVPVQRVRPHVPDTLELDTVTGPENEEFALVTATCFLNRDVHWTPMEEPSLDFHQSAFRTYVKHNGEPGVYLLTSYVERGTPHILERLAMKNAYPADFDILLSYDPETRVYGHYYCEILSKKGSALMEVSSAGQDPSASTPFKTGEEMAHFITHRLVNYFPMAGGLLGSARVEHVEMNPVQGDLLAGEFETWELFGILREEEFEQPYSVLIQPSIEMKIFPPTAV